MIELIMFLSVYNTIGYPEIIVDDGINKTKAYNLVYSFNYSEYHKLDKIHFTNQTNDKWLGYINITYKKGYRYTKGYITIYKSNYTAFNDCILKHELGHNYWIRYNFNLSEQLANDYMLNYDERCRAII